MNNVPLLAIAVARRASALHTRTLRGCKLGWLNGGWLNGGWLAVGRLGVSWVVVGSLVLSSCVPAEPNDAGSPDAATLDAPPRDAGHDEGTTDADTLDGAAEATLVVQGLYHHTFTGSVDGTELATWGPGPAEGSLVFSDLTAAGSYVAAIEPDGSFVFEGGVGSGGFSDDGHASMDFAFRGGLHFHSEIRRVPFTDARFPVFFTAAVAGDPSLTGMWDARVRDIDPMTGDVLAEARAEARVVVSGATVRVSLPDGTYHQASWIAPDQAALRVVAPPPSVAAYRTFPGCATSVMRDTLGDLRVSADGSISFTIAFQTRDTLGRQVQTMQHLTLMRVPAGG